MERLLDFQLDQLKGGGHWIEISPGEWVYLDEDEEADDDVMIWG